MLPVFVMLALRSEYTLIATTSQTPLPMLLKEDQSRSSCTFYHPSPSSAHRRAELVGKKLLILCTRVPTLFLQTRALLHGFNHVHLNLGYFGTMGLSSTCATPVEQFTLAC